MRNAGVASLLVLLFPLLFLVLTKKLGLRERLSFRSGERKQNKPAANSYSLRREEEAKYIMQRDSTRVYFTQRLINSSWQTDHRPQRGRQVFECR